MSIHFGGFNLDSEVDCYGFRKSKEFNDRPYREFIEFYRPILARRLKRWEKFFSTPASSGDTSTMALLNKKFTKRALTRFIQKGIPTSLRPRVWMAVSGAEQAMSTHPCAFEAYSCSKLPTDVANAIEIDLDRTFPDNDHFSSMRGNGRTVLKQVLRAVAAKRPDVGYCQGFNFIVGMLLLILNSPERAFWLMDSILDRFPSDFYGSNLRGVRVEIRMLQLIIKERAPDLDSVFHRFDVDLALLTTKWFICWFLENLPIETVFRLWDCLFSDGVGGADVLTRAAFTLITHHREQLLRCANFQNVADLFQNTIVADEFALNCHLFIQEMFETTKWLSAGQLKDWRRQVILANDY